MRDLPGRAGEVTVSFEAFLLSVISPHGLQTLVAAIIALLAEFLPSYATWTNQRKRTLTLLISLCVPLAAVGLGILTLDWPSTWPGKWWDAVQSAALFFGGTVLPTEVLRLGPKASK